MCERHIVDWIGDDWKTRSGVIVGTNARTDRQMDKPKPDA